MQMLMIRGTEAERELKSLAEYAADPEHWYKPGPGQKVPGDHAPFTRNIKIDTVSGRQYDYRIVFTFTLQPEDNCVYRHMSISVDDRRKLPDAFAVFTLAKFLGFTGDIKDWIIGLHPEDEGVTVVLQKIQEHRV